jgi:hypothetical protein
MPENTSNTVPCCVTDIGTGRIWWEWRQGHWMIAAKSASAPAQKRHDAIRHGQMCPSSQAGKRFFAPLRQQQKAGGAVTPLRHDQCFYRAYLNSGAAFS